MELLQYVLQLFGDRKSQVPRVLQQAHVIVGEVEEDDRRPQDASLSQHIDVQNVVNAHQREDQHLTADFLEADLAGERLVLDGAHDACHVVGNDKDE